METRPLSQHDVESAWAINEQGLPGTGQVSQQELSNLLNLSVLSIGAFQEGEMLGFVICLSPEQPMVVSIMHGSINGLMLSSMLTE